MKKLYIPFLALVSFLPGCEKPITVDVPRKESKLVVNGIMQKGEVLSLGIGKSRYILAPSNYMNRMDSFVVKNAVPVIYENGIAVDTLVYVPADYVYRSAANRQVRDGYSYSVKVTAPGFGTVESNTSMPSQSSLVQVSRIRDVRVNSYGDHMDEIILKFNDPAGERNFYLVQIFGSTYGGPEGHTVYCVGTNDKDIEPIGTNDPTGSDDCIDGGSLLMKDDNFNGRTKQVSFYVNSNDLSEYSDPMNGRIYRPYVKLNRITEEYFKYVKSYNLYYNASDNPFAEPVNVFSNVRNGYGLFTTFTAAVDTLR